MKKIMFGLFLIFLCVMAKQVMAADHFDKASLELSEAELENISLSDYEYPESTPSGKYYVDIFVNDEWQYSGEIDFISDGQRGVHAMVPYDVISDIGVDIGKNAIKNKSYIISKTIAYSQCKFDFKQQRLNYSIPQKYIIPSSNRRIINTDDGIAAAFSSYQASGARESVDGESINSFFANTYNGVNIGDWRLRNYSSISLTDAPFSSENSGFKSLQSFAWRDIPSISSKFTVGESFSNSPIFDSIKYAGIQLASSDLMLPDNQRGFSPTINGIANTYAKVTVSQNGAIIHQSYVPPGPFAIDDLYPNSNGDLLVTITESDGRESKFIQPFSSLPIMQREGGVKYSFIAGEAKGDLNSPIFSQGTIMYGLQNSTTVYGGLLMSPEYQSSTMGVGIGFLSLGAVSFDTSVSKVHLLDSGSEVGTSHRFQYSKSLSESGTLFTLASYRYSSDGYYSFYEYINNGEYGSHKKNKTHFNVSQILPSDFGSLSISYFIESYWEDVPVQKNLALSYNNNIDDVFFSLSYSFSSQDEQSNESQLNLSVSIPLSFGDYSIATYDAVRDSMGRWRQGVGISGSRELLDYNIHQYTGGDGDTTSANLEYYGPYAILGLGGSYDGHRNLLSSNAKGMFMMHEEGIIFGHSINNTEAAISIIEAPGLYGASINNARGVKVDPRGYAILSDMRPYKNNNISIDMDSLRDNQEIDGDIHSIVPTAGAVTLSKFKTYIGSKVLLSVNHNNGFIPFGAMVRTKREPEHVYISDENGEVFLAGMSMHEEIIVSWGKGKSQQCSANINLSLEKPLRSGIYRLNVNCN